MLIFPVNGEALGGLPPQQLRTLLEPAPFLYPERTTTKVRSDKYYGPSPEPAKVKTGWLFIPYQWRQTASWDSWRENFASDGAGVLQT